MLYSQCMFCGRELTTGDPDGICKNCLDKYYHTSTYVVPKPPYVPDNFFDDDELLGTQEEPKEEKHNLFDFLNNMDDMRQATKDETDFFYHLRQKNHGEKIKEKRENATDYERYDEETKKPNGLQELKKDIVKLINDIKEKLKKESKPHFYRGSINQVSGDYTSKEKSTNQQNYVELFTLVAIFINSKPNSPLHNSALQKIIEFMDNHEKPF